MIGPTLYASAPALAGTTGAVVGEEARTPNLSWILSSGQIVSTGDLQAGETPDMGGLTDMAVEFWIYPLTGPPAANLDFMVGPQAVASPGTTRQWRMTYMTNGWVEFAVMDNGGTERTAQSNLALPLNTWTHVYGGRTTTDISVHLNGEQLGNSAFAASTVKANQLEPNLSDFYFTCGSDALIFDEIAIYRYALPQARITEHYEAGRNRGFIEQSTGARINAVLDESTSVAARSINAGDRSVTPRYMAGQAPLDEIRAAVGAEAVDAFFFAARDGTLVYLDSAHRSGAPYSTVQATFDDDGTDTPYLDVQVDYSESFLTNEWNVTRLFQGAETQTARDTASITKYFKRSNSVSGIPVVADSDCADIAAAMLAKYKDPMTRITQITFNTLVSSIATTVLSRELGDKVRVFKRYAGGVIDQTVFIQKIEVSGQAGGLPWEIRWSVSPV